MSHDRKVTGVLTGDYSSFPGHEGRAVDVEDDAGNLAGASVCNPPISKAFLQGSVREAEEGLLQTKQPTKQEKLKSMKKSFFEAQSVIFKAFHSIVLPSIVCVTLGDIQTAIKNGSFETLLQIWKNIVRQMIEEQSATALDSSTMEFQCFCMRNINGTIEMGLLDELRKQAASFWRKKKDDQPAEMETIKKKFLQLICATKLRSQLDLEDPDNANTDQCQQAAKRLIEGFRDRLEEWCFRSDIYEMHELSKELNYIDDSRTIGESKTLLQNAKTHGFLNIMLKRSGIFRPVLKTLLTRFNAFNERIQPDLDSPLHYAIRNLDNNFLQWLQKQQSLDINIRNKQKKTVLFILCEQYDWVRKKIKNPGKNDNRDELCETLEKYRHFIEHLLSYGADLNICSSKALLPYEFLTIRQFNFTQNGYTASPWLAQLQREEEEFLERCDNLVRNVGRNVILKRDGKSKKFPTENFGEITVELLEIFLRFEEQDLFTNELQKLKLKEADEKKVITFLLHLAVELNMHEAVKEIFIHCGKQIFAPATNNASELKYRVELKGLLSKACNSANKVTLIQLVNRMDKDKLLINDECILVYTLNRYRTLSDNNAKLKTLECAQWMASDGRIHQSRTDSYGNTALHAALKYGFLDVAKSLLSNSKFVYLGVKNNKGETLMTYATHDFYKSYLDDCVKTMPGSGPKGDVLIDLEAFNPFAFKKTKEKKYRIFPKIGTVHDSGRRVFSSMDCIKNIAENKDHKPLLYHPTIYTFILIEWIRYSNWHIANLLFTLLTSIAFGYFSLDYICNDHFSPWSYILSCFGVVYIFMREVLQWVVFGKKYLWALQNWMDITNITGMILVLTFVFRSVVSALSIIILAIQIIQLIGSLPFNTISTYRTMFRMVALNVIKSLALFSPLLAAFAFSFFVIYNDTKASNTKVIGDNSSFNKFGSASTAGVKILVMATGEFEAAAMSIDGNVIIIFLLFIFCVPMVIQNLINGLAISDIAEIRSQSESISLTEKVQLLAQFEEGLSRVTCKPIRMLLRHLRKLSPALFFRTYSSKIKISVDDGSKIMIKPIHTILGNQQQSKSDAPSKDLWQYLPRIPRLNTFVVTLEDAIVEELLLIGNQNAIGSSHRSSSKSSPDGR